MREREVLDAQGRVMVREEEFEDELEYQAQPERKKIHPNNIAIDNDMWLRVYIDDENHKYYIDVFAAFSLGMISYQEACQLYDNGLRYYEISLLTLRKLESMFKNRIKYYYFKNNTIVEQSNDNNKYDNHDDNKRKFLGEMEINNYKVAFPKVNNDDNKKPMEEFDTGNYVGDFPEVDNHKLR